MRLLPILRTGALFAVLLGLVSTGIAVTFIGLADSDDLGAALGGAALAGAVAVLTTMVVLADRRR
jgi:hypothetical protein